MLNFRVLAYLLIAISTISSVNAAIIHGTIYDFSLKKLNNARVEINTSPKQFLIAQNGTYSFNVPNGDYMIKAQLMQKNTVVASVQENITIKQDGNYILDLILFPDIEEGVEDVEIEVNENVIGTKNNIPTIFILVFILIIILIVIFYFIKHKKRKEEHEDNDLEQIIKLIKQEGGRTTQKDIRKHIPLSEAKISLMLAELEHKGIIEKIKKGRGNIVILKKK